MRYLLAGSILAAALAAGPNAAADTIWYTDQRKETSGVTVLDETLKEVQYRQKRIRQVQTIDAAKVDRVEYSDTSDEYQVALEAFNSGAYGDAAVGFQAAAAEERRKGLKAKAMYLRAESLRRNGELQEAVKAFGELQKEQPDSRYIPDCILGKGLALLQGRNESGARKAFEELKEYGGRWAYESELRLQMLDEPKDPTRALQTYKRLAQATERDYPSVANQAKLRIGRVLIAERKYKEARDYFQAVVDNRTPSTPREVIAGAFNGLGAAIWNDPGADADDLREALYHHLRVVVSYSDVLDEQPEALYSAGVLFSVVPCDENTARSRYYLNRCVTLYGDTPFGIKAREGVPASLQRKVADAKGKGE